MNFGQCPNCSAEFEIKPDQTNATYTMTCVTCLEAFSYRVVDGEFEKWEAPRIAGIEIRGKRLGGTKTTPDKNGIPVIRSE